MDPTQQRQVVRDALSGLGIGAAAVSSFDDDALDKLFVGKFHSLERLQWATREGLKDAGLAPGDVCLIMSKVQGGGAGGAAAATGAAAGPGSGSTAAGAAPAGLDVVSVTGAVLLDRLDELKQELQELQQQKQRQQEMLQQQEQRQQEMLQQLEQWQQEMLQQQQQWQQEMLQQQQQWQQEMLQQLEQRQQEIQQFLRLFIFGQFKPTSSCSSRDSKTYRQQAFALYGYGNHDDVQCVVTGELMPCSTIKAGHIFRQGWNTGMLPMLGIASVHDPCNIILVRSEVEAAFDRFELTIIPHSDEGGSGVFEIHVLKPSLLTGSQQYIGTGAKRNSTGKPGTMKWVDVHMSRLHVKGDKLPSRRLLAMHAMLAISTLFSKAGWRPVRLRFRRRAGPRLATTAL